jgi:hypothetical protein
LIKCPLPYCILRRKRYIEGAETEKGKTMTAYSEKWFSQACEAALSECIYLGGELEEKAKAEFLRRSKLSGPVPLHPSLIRK